MATEYGYPCGEKHGEMVSWVCTEVPGHDGPHRAGDGYKTVFHAWKEQSDPIDCPEIGCYKAAGHDHDPPPHLASVAHQHSCPRTGHLYPCQKPKHEPEGMTAPYASDAERLLAALDSFAANDGAGYRDLCEIVIDAIMHDSDVFWRLGPFSSAGAIAALQQREAHVIDVLREAQREGGGYGFVRQLLQHLGATEVGA